MISEILLKLIENRNLTTDETKNVMTSIMSGKLTSVQIGAFLALLRKKGETIEEISACAKIMREVSHKITSKYDNLIDTCGTGGDIVKTLNVSTAVMFVVAGAGFSVAKHGNRSVTSTSGSADVLEYLGFDLTQSPSKIESILNDCGVTFMFAPIFHPSMKYAVAPRKELGIRTVFNILGPLTNPAGTKFQVVGVYDENLTEVVAEVLLDLGTTHSLVVHGVGGFDEVSTFGRTKISEVCDKKIETYYVDPSDFGVQQRQKSEVECRLDAEKNAQILVSILHNKKGPLYDLVLVNSAAALKALKNIDFVEGVKVAAESIESGAAYKKLRSFMHLGAKSSAVLDDLEATLCIS